MRFKALRFLSHHRFPQNTSLQFIRTLIDDIDIKFVRDRGLDHAVEKEKDIKSMLNLKNLIKCEPSKSLPLSTVAENRDKLKIPCRPIEFIRKYPSIFDEYFPGNIGIHPHVRLTHEVLSLDSEEQLVYDSDTFQKGAADRLLKLLMLCRTHEIPLKLIDLLKWDLGLPDNYVTSLVPHFPDYFKIKRLKLSSIGSSGVAEMSEGLLELVCWSDDLAVSVIEKRALKGQLGFQKGMPIAFPLQFSKGFEMDKKLKKWINEWQRLPYISPYENASHLQPKSDESDKWAVAVLHEFLHILVPKKMERDNILCLGEYLGIRSRFKRALVQHPGIFYLSSKNGTYTVVLREGYKRGMLIEKHPLMDMRSKYIHLMHTVKEVQKLKTVSGPSVNKQQVVKESGGKEKKGEDNGEEPCKEMHFSGSDIESESVDDDEEAEEEDKSRRGRCRSASSRGGRRNDSTKSEHRVGRRGTSKANEDGRRPVRAARQERSPRKYSIKT